MQEPLSPTDEAMASLHEMYLSLRRKGFNRFEACIIIGTFLAQSAAQNQVEE